MKKLFALILALCLLLAGCTPAAEPATTAPTTVPTTTVTQPAKESAVTPLLYQVTDENGHSVWLFGSIHVGREDFYPLPDYVIDAFDAAEALAVEFDIRAYEKDIMAAAKDMSLMVYTDGSTIKDHIDPQLYEDAAALLEDAPIPISMLDRYMPVMWFSLIESMMLDTGTIDPQLGIDLHMIDTAYAADKPVISIESASFQYGLLAGFSPELQEFILQDVVNSVRDGSLMENNEKLLNIWAEGSEQAFIDYLYTDIEGTDEELALYEQYNKALVFDRNISMTDFAESALKEGKSMMICVGAAHIIGEGAMAQLLEERGYTVTKLSPN